MASPNDGSDIPSLARGKPMVSGELMARIARAKRGNIDLVHRLEALIEDLGRDITARLAEDPPGGDISDLAERYHDLCDTHLKVFRSLHTLSSYLKAFDKELAAADLRVARSSTVGTTDQECDRSLNANTSTLSSFLDTFDKELEDQAAATSSDPSAGDKIDRGRDEAPRPGRSRI